MLLAAFTVWGAKMFFRNQLCNSINAVQIASWNVCCYDGVVRLSATRPPIPPQIWVVSSAAHDLP